MAHRAAERVRPELHLELLPHAALGAADSASLWRLSLMSNMHHSFKRLFSRWPAMLLALVALPFAALSAFAQDAAGGEANLKVPDLSQVSFLNGIPGDRLLMWGLLVCALGLAFGVVIYSRLKAMPVHESMLEVSELIYETCKTYLTTQGKFILLLEVFIGAIMIVYFGFLRHFEVAKVVTILIFSLIGIGGSYGVAWFGIRVNTFANSRSAFASLRGKPFPTYEIPLKAGMSIGTMLICVELMMMLCILLFVPR